MLAMTGHAKKLSDLGIVIPNRLGINRVLQSLPPSYKNFVMNYNMQNMNKELSELFGMLKAAEIEIKKEHQVLMVNKTTSFKKQGKSKGKFKKGGKKAATPPMKPKNGPKPDAECYYCKEKGHWKRNCSKYLADLKSGLVKKKKEVPAPMRKFRPGTFREPQPVRVQMFFPDRKFRWSWPEVPIPELGRNLVNFGLSSAQVPPHLLLSRTTVEGGSSGPHGRYFRWKPELPVLLELLVFHVGAGIPGVAPHYISPPSTFNVLLGSYWFHVGAGIPGVAPHYISPPSTFNVLLGSYCASNELWRIIVEGFKPYNPDKLTRREAVDSQLNNTALHMIQTAVGTKELSRVRHFTTAKDAWDGLAASCIGSESTRRNKYNALRNKAEGFMRLPDEDHEDMYGRLLTVADAFRNVGATHINDSWIKEKYIECMMPFEPIDVKTLVGRECYASLTSQQAVHEMQALKVLEQNSHDSRNRAIGMTKGSNLALVVNSREEVIPQESYRASWSMTYPEDLEHHYHDHMAFHANTFWIDPSKAKEDNIKRNNSRGPSSSGPRTRSCYNCNDKRHFIAECPYENRETHGGRLIPKDKSKDSKGKYSKPPNKKFYNKNKKGKRPSRIVLVANEEYSSDEIESASDDEEESSREVAAIVTTNIPSSSLFDSPNENPQRKNAHCFMARSTLDTSIVLSTQEEYTSGDEDVDDEEDATSNGLVALASLSTNSSSTSESPNEVIHVEEESFLMAKSSELSSPIPSMPNISNDLGVDPASLKVKQEMLEFDDFISNLQGNTKKHVSSLMVRIAQLNDTLEKKCQIEREDSLEIHALKNALEECQETIASLEERLENLEEPQDKLNKLTKARDLARAKTKVLIKEKAKFGVDHEKLVKDLDELDKAHKALKSEYSLLSESYEQLQIRLASYDIPSTSTPSCDHANIIEENARLKDELAKASSPQSKLSLDDLLSKQRSNNGKEGLGYNTKAKANKKKTKPAHEKANGETRKGKTINDDGAGIDNPHYVLFKDYYGDVYAKYVGPYDGYVAWSIWVPKTLVANKRGPIEKWVPKSKN
ncbi:hypothetical protein QYE76_051464 [Lolium multiflorum]|uniref:CCHC-type domain-containing protein n=1 Tax=Lolium multiflorum TaxID=4521 RepID=A0AAD8SSU6_LOLMU|nr:hypothetical protein QYE76_051464 [Lolium multiflorum]